MRTRPPPANAPMGLAGAVDVIQAVARHLAFGNAGAPPDIEVLVDVGESFATVTFPMATAMDNVDDVGDLTVISSAPGDSQFQTGDTVVAFIAEDSSGNPGMATMNVRVLAPPP